MRGLLRAEVYDYERRRRGRSGQCHPLAHAAWPLARTERKKSKRVPCTTLSSRCLPPSGAPTESLRTIVPEKPRDDAGGTRTNNHRSYFGPATAEPPPDSLPEGFVAPALDG